MWRVNRCEMLRYPPPHFSLQGQLRMDNHVELPCRDVQNDIFGYSAQPSPYAELPPTIKTLCDGHLDF